MKPSGLSVPLMMLFTGVTACSREPRTLPAVFDYEPLERVLTTYVNPEGQVSYAALGKDRVDLDQMVEEFSRLSPADAPPLFPTRDAQLAYYINAYNTWVLRIVVDHYPTSSITKIGLIPYGALFIKRIRLGGKSLTLRGLENGILRDGFRDPRIHFAINCASRSCPPLAQHVYRPGTLDAQLDAAARDFINDNRQVTLDEAGHRIILSKIFDWYASDFRQAYAVQFHREGTVLDYLEIYLNPERRQALHRLSGAKVTYYKYDWSLNDRPLRP